MKISFWGAHLMVVVFLARAVDADIIQGAVTEAGTNAPLEGVKVASDSAHAVLTGVDGAFNLDTQAGITGLASPKSRQPGLVPSQKSSLFTTINSMPVGTWAWFNLLGRPVGVHVAANRIAGRQADADKEDADLAKSSASEAMNTLTFQKAGYLTATQTVNGSRTGLNVQLQIVPVGGDVSLWYEAEAPGNILFNILGAGGRTSCGPTCVGDPKEGESCCSGGGELTQLLGRCDTKAPSSSTNECQDAQGPGGGGVTFTGVNVPKAGTYDITWWYHAGSNDNWNDHDCGGVPAPAWMTYFNPKANPQPGCRPQLIAVNGKEVDGPKGERYWQFPVYGGGWDVMHAATTTLTLAAGDNTVQLAAPRIGDLDAVDIDAIHVQAVDKGNPPKVVAPTTFAGDGRK